MRVISSLFIRIQSDHRDLGNLQPKTQKAAPFYCKELKMKLALIFLSIFVAISHQQYFHPRMMFGFPWMSSFSQQPIAVHDYNEEVYPVLMGLDSRDGNDQDDEFNDIQSRIKGSSGNLNGLSRYRPISPSSFNNQQNGRFFFNWANTGNTGNNANNNNNNFNLFFKTATFTLTSTVTLASIQSCVPANNFFGNATPPPAACRRKRSEIENSHQENQFPITPSETFKVMPTALLSPQDHSLDVVSSSRDDVTSDESLSADFNLREKRFFYGNKNLFLLSTTLTTFAFVNTTITVTANLLPPVPAAGCVAASAAAPGDVVCLACLPAGYITCPLAG